MAVIRQKFITLLVILILSVTGGVVDQMGVSVDAQTLKPISSTDIAHRVAYAGVQATVKSGVDAALLSQKGEFLNNLRDSFGTQAHAATSSAIGASYLAGDLNYPEHKLSHALTGTAYGLATNSNVLASAVAPTTAEITGEAVLNSKGLELIGKMGSAEITPTQFQDGLADLRNDIAVTSKLTGALTGFVAGDTAAGAASSATAVENNIISPIDGVILGADVVKVAYAYATDNPALMEEALVDLATDLIPGLPAGTSRVIRTAAKTAKYIDKTPPAPNPKLIEFNKLSPNEQEIIRHIAKDSDQIIIGNGTVYGDRLPRDVSVNPKQPKDMDLEGRKVGKSKTQNEIMHEDVQYLKDNRARDIRINQQQINNEKCRVGICRPDVQATLADGKRIIIEYDTSKSTRGPEHADRAIRNDPNVIIILRKVD